VQVLIRYPGSKDQHLDRLMPWMRGWTSIAEPFAGTAAVTFGLLKRRELQKVWLNDLDPEIVGLLKTVRDNPDELCRRVEAYRPRMRGVRDFYRIRDEVDPHDGSDLDRAFNKIVIHQISYSGIGRAAGSPIGGRTQTNKKTGAPSEYLVDCRWNPKILTKKIRECHDLFGRAEHVHIQGGDALECLDIELPIYLDPPYSTAGQGLYHRGAFVPELVERLRGRTDPWVMSYDAAGAEPFRPFARVIPVTVTSHLHNTRGEDREDHARDVIVVPRFRPTTET